MDNRWYEKSLYTDELLETEIILPFYSGSQSFFYIYPSSQTNYIILETDFGHILISIDIDSGSWAFFIFLGFGVCGIASSIIFYKKHFSNQSHMKSKETFTKSKQDQSSDNLALAGIIGLCPICRHNIKDTEEYNQCQSCGTFFHWNCIKKWFIDENHKFCPSCSGNFGYIG